MCPRGPCGAGGTPVGFALCTPYPCKQQFGAFPRAVADDVVREHSGCTWPCHLVLVTLPTPTPNLSQLWATFTLLHPAMPTVKSALSWVCWHLNHLHIIHQNGRSNVFGTQDSLAGQHAFPWVFCCIFQAEVGTESCMVLRGHLQEPWV